MPLNPIKCGSVRNKTKKMKQLLLLISFITSVTISAQKQGDVTINVILNPIQSITINPDQLVINLEYKTKSDYLNGVAENKTNHIKVFSTGSFEIKVKSNNPTLSNGNRNIPVSDIRITPTIGTDNLTDAVFTPISLSVSEQTIASSNKGVADKSISVTYQSKGESEYVELYNHSTSNTFSSIIIYTIIPF